jgi:hypothetical protein
MSRKSLITSGLITLLAVWIAWLPQTAQAQYDRERRTVECSSINGQRAFCDAFTGGGVHLNRQLSQARCEEGSSWGYTDRGIWVDRGCRAEFSVAEPRGNMYPDQSGRFTVLEPGTVLPVRTNETIDSDRADGRIFTGIIDQDVRGGNGQLAIPRGSDVEMIVRVAPDNDLILDLEAVIVNGQRYAIRAGDRIESREGVGRNRRTGEYVGGGALLGSIIGAIAGGGKGAAIGAAAGAAAGAGTQTLTRGRMVRVPRESLLTFRLERPLEIGVADTGFSRDGRHYHNYNEYERNR